MRKKNRSLTSGANTLNIGPPDAGWSSQVARRAHNPKVAGSNPAPATKAAYGLPFCVGLLRRHCTRPAACTGVQAPIGLVQYRSKSCPRNQGGLSAAFLLLAARGRRTARSRQRTADSEQPPAHGRRAAGGLADGGLRTCGLAALGLRVAACGARNADPGPRMRVAANGQWRRGRRTQRSGLLADKRS